MSFFNHKKGSKKGYIEREENFYYEIVLKACWSDPLYTTVNIARNVLIMLNNLPKMCLKLLQKEQFEKR